jgi:hypothetical protein
MQRGLSRLPLPTDRKLLEWIVAYTSQEIGNIGNTALGNRSRSTINPNVLALYEAALELLHDRQPHNWRPAA